MTITVTITATPTPATPTPKLRLVKATARPINVPSKAEEMLTHTRITAAWHRVNVYRQQTGHLKCNVLPMI